MNPDELRDRLAGIDPTLHHATDAATTPSSRSRLERIMQTEPSPTATSTTSRQRRGGIWIAAAAAALLVVAVGVVLAGDGDDEQPAASGPPLALSLGASDTMASCLPVSADILADMPVAFAGTATEVEGETVTLEVQEWFVGGDASTVVLHANSGMEALIDGFAFEEGTDYLVSATDGTVNFCGFSGPATTELRTVYDEAFPT